MQVECNQVRARFGASRGSAGLAPGTREEGRWWIDAAQGATGEKMRSSSAAWPSIVATRWLVTGQLPPNSS